MCIEYYIMVLMFTIDIIMLELKLVTLIDFSYLFKNIAILLITFLMGKINS